MQRHCSLQRCCVAQARPTCNAVRIFLVVAHGSNLIVHVGIIESMTALFGNIGVTAHNMGMAIAASCALCEIKSARYYCGVLAAV